MRRQLDTILASLRSVALPDPAPTSDAALLRAFVERRDRDALELLIRRHAGAVWRTCLRAAPSLDDAEDAFQATCYILATKARSIRNPEAVAAWLHRVALRAAVAARATLRAHTTLASDPPAPAATSVSADSGEALCVLEQEVQRLPDKYRLPLVLCYLDGKTNAEAAALLGIPEGTVYSRLARGRDRLRGRLVRRGLAPALAAAALPTAASQASAASSVLLEQAVQFAVAAPSVAETSAMTLAKGVLDAMWWNQCRKLGIIAAAVLCVSIAGWRLTTTSAQAPAAGQPAGGQPVAKQSPQPAAPNAGLAELHRKRIAIAAKVYEQREAEYLAGKTTFPTFVQESALKLLEAERDADPRNEPALLNRYRERMVKLRDLSKQKFDVGALSYASYGAFEFAVAEADVWIEQVRLRGEGRERAPAE